MSGYGRHRVRHARAPGRQRSQGHAHGPIEAGEADRAGSVWVSDWNNDVVRRFSITGEPMANLESAGLEGILASSRKERWKYTIFSYAGVAGVVLLFIVLTVRALTAGPAQTRKRRSVTDDEVVAEVPTESLHLEPDETMRRRMSMAVGLAGLLLLLAVAGLAFTFEVLDNPEVLRLLTGPFAALFAIVLLIIWVNKANWGTSVAVNGNTVTLQDHNGQQSRCPIRQVRYDAAAIATDDAVVILKLPNAHIYKREDIQDRLMPRLADEQKVGPIAMLKLQIQTRHPQGLVVVLAVIGVVLYGAVRIAS